MISMKNQSYQYLHWGQQNLSRFVGFNTTLSWVWPSKQQATTALAPWAKKRWAGVKKREREHFKNMEEKNKWKRGGWKPQVSLLIHQQHAWQPPDPKWMCTPQGSGPLLSNRDKEQGKWRQEASEEGRVWKNTALSVVPRPVWPHLLLFVRD